MVSRTTKKNRKNVKRKIIIEIISGKINQAFKKVPSQNYVLHDDPILYHRKSVLRCSITEIVLATVVPTLMDLTIMNNVHASIEHFDLTSFTRYDRRLEHKYYRVS